MAVLTFVAFAMGGALGAATATAATGCAGLDEVRAQAECSARERARSEARAEVQRRVADDTSAAEARGAGDGASGVGAGTEAGSSSPARPKAWREALAAADGPHLDTVLEPRPIATIVGALWFGLVFRARVRTRARARRSGP